MYFCQEYWSKVTIRGFVDTCALQVMRCKLNGHNTPSTKLYLGVVGLLTALVVILLTSTSYFPASRISADKFSQARSFLQQIQGLSQGDSCRLMIFMCFDLHLSVRQLGAS